MNIDKLFDKDYLIERIEFFKSKKQIRKIDENKELVKAHIKKSKHNIRFFNLNKANNEYNDWLIVILYYALYHSALALITNKKFSSKNHHATILILIKEYNISKKEVELLDELCIDKEDAELYTSLKSDRHDASYNTGTRFNDKVIEEYEERVIDFINKTEEFLMFS